jgi:glutathione S-transferase
VHNNKNKVTTIMVLKIHGVEWSLCTQRVLTTLKEKQVPYEIVVVDFIAGEHKGEKYLQKQPFGVLPVLEDDGFFVYESRAICRYIEAKFKGQGTELIPSDLKGLALFEQGASIETSYFDPQVSALAFELIFKKLKGLGEPDATRAKQLTDKLAANLDVYDKILSKQQYIGGDSFTLADIAHLPYGTYLSREQIKLGHLITERPNVKAWWDRITSRQSWQETVSGKV